MVPADLVYVCVGGGAAWLGDSYCYRLKQTLLLPLKLTAFPGGAAAKALVLRGLIRLMFIADLTSTSRICFRCESLAEISCKCYL